MADREHLVMDLLCGKLQTQRSYCDQSCTSCKFYHEESDMGAKVSICVHGFGSKKESCGCYMTQHEYLEFVRSGFASIQSENEKLRELFQKTWKWEKNGCYECPLEKECKALCVYDGDCGMAVEIERELQEMGIKV